MRIGLMVDAACDVSQAFIEQEKVIILPIRTRLDGTELIDDRDPAVRREFLKQGLGARGYDAETEPLAVEAIRELFLDRLVVEYDSVVCMTIAGTRSPIHARTSQAAYAILSSYRPIRQAAGVTGPFLLRVIDTGNVFSGQAPALLEAARLRAAGANPGQLRERVEEIARHSYGWLLPRDLYYLRARARKKGDRSIGWLGAAVGNALDIKPLLRAHRGETTAFGRVRGFEPGAEQLFAYTADRVRAGLLTPDLCLAYGGDPALIAELPGFDGLQAASAEAGVGIHIAPMGITGMINVGTGALAVAFAAPDHDARP